MIRKLRSIVLLVLPVSLLACGGNGPTSGEGELGSAELAITQVPAGVRCVQVLAQGSRTVEHLYTVTANQSSILTMDALPVGQVQFSGNAFSTSCASGVVGQTPAYVADAVFAQIVSGSAASVKLNMRRNGRATVSVDFEADCVAAGASCANGAACCNGLSCVADAAGTGISTCTASTTCAAAGASCANGVACCSGLLCVTEPSTAMSTCTATTCAGDGAACGGSVVCCNGLSCQDPNADGVSTCSPPTCAVGGAVCGPDTVCCNGLSCVDAAGTGVGVCSTPACAMQGVACGGAVACCGNLVCMDPYGTGNAVCMP
jgi:hypothetical protein